jgi:alkylation response protein AidB-like acyl-CoA dehydrogenase
VNFELSPEQYLLEHTVRSYLLAEHPVAQTLARAEAGVDRTGRDAGAWKGLADLGLGGVVVPEEYGGLGLGVLDIAVASQALGYGAAPGPWIAHWLATSAIVRAGSEEQRRRWLPGLADGSLQGALVWSERGTPVLGGRSADVLVVHTAVGLGLVDREANPSVSITALPGVDLTRPIDEVNVPADAVEPLLRGDAEMVSLIRAVGHVLVAADAFGGSLRVLQLSVAYAKARHQWGQEIGRFQAVKHQLADLALLVEPARGLFWYAAHAIDAGLADAVADGALAKAHLTDGYVKAVRAAIELHGGFGYTWECDLHVYLKRALLDRQYLGDPESLRQQLANAQFGPVTAPV